MNEPNQLIELIKYTIPALAVVVATWLVLKTLLDSQETKLKLENRRQAGKILTPLKIQAYERIILFLERVSPQSLLVRVNTPNLTVRQFQQQLTGNIRSEFEHNLSQQLYISEEAWELVKNAKENMTRLINSAAANLDSKAPAIELSKILFEVLTKAENSPLDATISEIKKEFAEISSQFE